ncbi:uncharacterized protein LOC473763 isoform X1 [Pan troglodytes]|uniref:uncharacterized protein LOC473763 isoform X1 n=1 Tax=Pan troglodytes TaxID=9598 RepID=UPI003013783B
MCHCRGQSPCSVNINILGCTKHWAAVYTCILRWWSHGQNFGVLGLFSRSVALLVRTGDYRRSQPRVCGGAPFHQQQGLKPAQEKARWHRYRTLGIEDREELIDAIPPVISVIVSGENEEGKIPSKCKQGAAAPAAPAECRGSAAGPGPMDKEKLVSGSGHELRKPEDSQQLLWLFTFTLVQLQELKNIFQLVPYPDVLDGVSLCRPGWSAVARSWLTATSTSRFYAILLPQPPE